MHCSSYRKIIYHLFTSTVRHLYLNSCLSSGFLRNPKIRMLACTLVCTRCPRLLPFGKTDVVLGWFSQSSCNHTVTTNNKKVKLLDVPRLIHTANYQTPSLECIASISIQVCIFPSLSYLNTWQSYLANWRAKVFASFFINHLFIHILPAIYKL